MCVSPASMSFPEKTALPDNRVRPKVSVTVVTYNHGNWLRECLESIVNQKTDFPFEIVVGDDASTDGLTAEVLQEYAARYPEMLVPVIREKNLGGTQNLLDLVRRTRGEYIAHIDGDDYMLPGKLQCQADFLDVHPDFAIVGHEVRIIDGATGRTLAEKFLDTDKPKVADVDYLVLNGCYFVHSSKMYRRSATRSWQRDHRTIDFFFHVEQASHGRIGFLHEVLGVYRRVGGSASDPASKLGDGAYRAYLEAFERARELGVRDDVVRKGILRYRYSSAFDLLRCGMDDAFSRMIRLAPSEIPFATLRHQIAHCLRAFPKFVRRHIGHF